MVKKIAWILCGVIVLLGGAVAYGFYIVLHTASPSEDRVIATVVNTTSDTTVRKDVPTDTRRVVADTTSAPLTFAFVGDMNFDRYIRTVAEKRGYAFLLGDDVRALLAQHTCVVGNLEGPITSHASVSQHSVMGAPDNYRFTFDPAVVPFLTDAHFCAVTIGNNHSGNFGADGIATTRAHLGGSPVTAFGDTGDTTERFVIKDFSGTRVAFVGANMFVADGAAHADADVRAARSQADFVLVYPHWGTEYASTATDTQRQQARAWIDAGADAVIGAHPHVVQDTEVYNGKTIYYSVGNFIFDQYFRPDTQQGLIVTVTIDPQSATLTFHDTPVTMRSTGQTVLRQVSAP